MAEPAALEGVADLLEGPRTVAVLGAHPEVHRAAHYVPAYMREQGWRVVPVNPTRPAGEVLFGEPVRATLREAGAVDMINVFRPSHALEGHLAELLAAGAPVVWFQLGIEHAAVAAELRAAGIRVVQDRCLLADHRRWKRTG